MNIERFERLAVQSIAMPTNETIRPFASAGEQELKKWIEILRAIEEGTAVTEEDLAHLRLLRIHLVQSLKGPEPKGSRGSN